VLIANRAQDQRCFVLNARIGEALLHPVAGFGSKNDELSHGIGKIQDLASRNH
jgi:hypothetical protein